MSTKHHEKIARRCVDNAQKMLGDGWKHVSADIQWGLVSANILAIVQGQDESIPAETVLRLLENVTAHARFLMELD